MKKINWTNHFIEFATVVFGIILAFSLNSWNEDRKDKELAKQYLEGIKAEVEDNLSEVETKLAYHDSLLTQLRTDPKNVRLIIRASNLKNYAWSMAQNSSFNRHTDYELQHLLLTCYQLQGKLDEHNKNTGELMSYLNIMGPMYMLAANLDNFTDEEFDQMSVAGWIPIFEDMTTYEKELAHIYQLILEKMKKEE